MRLEADFDEVPEDAVFEYGISIVVYMHQDGTQRYGILTQGSMSSAGIIGVLEMAKKMVLDMNSRT